MPRKFYHPRYWPTWFGIAILRLIVLLPWRWQMAIGKGLGELLYISLPKRRKISDINLRIAFPELNEKQRRELNRKHFVSLGRGLIEAALGWWGSEDKIKRLSHVENLHYLEDALKKGPVILLGAHFSSLEVGGRMLAQHMPLHVVYRPHQNELIEYLVALGRDKRYGKAIPKTRMRDMIKSIKAGFPTWYATDQNYRGKGSIPAPFFGVDAPTNPGTARLAKMTRAKVLPCITVRLLDDQEERKGYLIRALPPLDNFPSDDAAKDTLRLNRILEDLIREFPDQYLWTHKRYKRYDSEKGDFYRDFAIKEQSGRS